MIESALTEEHKEKCKKLLIGYIKEVLPVALKYENHVFRNDWAFQQDGARPPIHHLTQKWY